MDKRYSPIIHNKLRQYAAVGNWQGMLEYLHGLTHSNFRTASYVLAERILPELESGEYWQCFDVIAVSDTKVFLITFLKAAIEKYNKRELDFENEVFVSFARRNAPLEQSLDRQKTLCALLPLMRTHTEVTSMLTAFCNDDAERKCRYLIMAGESMPCYYAMFQAMRQMDHCSDVLTKNLLFVIKRATPMAFNFACIMRAYFDLTKINARFSLTLQPYELSRIEKGYDEFSALMTKVH